MKHSFIALAVVSAVFLAYPSYAEVVNRIVAIVNDEAISLYDVEKQSHDIVEKARAEYKGISQRENIYEAKRQILQQIIDKKLANAETEKLGIKVTKEEIDKAIERIKRDNSVTHEELLARLEAEGSSLTELRKQLEEEIERAKLIDREVRARIVIPEEEIVAYYDENIDQFSGESRIWLQNILISVAKSDSPEDVKDKRELASRLARELQAGASFEETANKYSNGPNAAGGGDLGYLETDDLAEYLRDAISDLKKGEVSDVIDSPYGFQIVKIVDRQSEGTKSLEEVRPIIQNILYREQINEKYTRWIKELREKAYIKVMF